MEFERRMEARRLEPGDEQGLKALRRGWCLGSEEFKQQQLEEMDGQVGQHHFGQMRLKVAEAKAERIIAEETTGRGLQEADLVSRRKRGPKKLALPVRLRKETTLTVKQNAVRLHWGTPGSARGPHRSRRNARTRWVTERLASRWRRPRERDGIK